jgi:hypothetical protein
MTAIGVVSAPGLSADLLCCAQSDWIERCRACIGEREPLLNAADVLDLALALWDLPRCQLLLPELAARLLLADQLGQVGLTDAAG